MSPQLPLSSEDETRSSWSSPSDGIAGGPLGRDDSPGTHLLGKFPGGEVDLRTIFTLLDGAIQKLNITI